MKRMKVIWQHWQEFCEHWTPRKVLIWTVVLVAPLIVTNLVTCHLMVKYCNELAGEVSK